MRLIGSVPAVRKKRCGNAAEGSGLHRNKRGLAGYKASHIGFVGMGAMVLGGGSGEVCPTKKEEGGSESHRKGETSSSKLSLEPIFSFGYVSRVLRYSTTRVCRARVFDQ